MSFLSSLYIIQKLRSEHSLKKELSFSFFIGGIYKSSEQNNALEKYVSNTNMYCITHFFNLCNLKYNNLESDSGNREFKSL